MRRTTVAIAIAESLWRLSDAVGRLAELTETAASSIGNAGHAVLDRWAAYCERKGI